MLENLFALRNQLEEQLTHIGEETAGKMERNGILALVFQCLVLILHESTVYGVAMHAEVPIEHGHFVTSIEVFPGLAKGNLPDFEPAIHPDHLDAAVFAVV